MPSDSGASWSPPASNGERRLSNSSDGSVGSGYSKATSESADFVGTRSHPGGVSPGKPSGNPLRFVRVGPAELGCRAREQLRKAELAKRTEPAKVERQEDWQSNLDNWKSCRRKRVEHIIERCVEVRRMENEPSQTRSKSKTFNEMLEERAGRRRRNLPIYLDDDGHDLSDLGIGTSSTKSSLSEDCDTHSLASDGMDLEKSNLDVDNLSTFESSRKLGSSANEYDTCTTATISSPEPEEFTYESAIEGYKSRIISSTNSEIIKTMVQNNGKEKSPEKLGTDLNRNRITVSNKIEEKMTSFQQEKVNESMNSITKKDLPKVDITKRREQFERESSQELQSNKPKLPDVANKRSIKDRLSSLEKFTEETQKSTNDVAKLTVEVKPLKERLSSLEKVKGDADKGKRFSNGDLNNSMSVKERLTNLTITQSSIEEANLPKNQVREVSMSLKERLSSLDAAKNKEVPKVLVDSEITNEEKNHTAFEEAFKNTESSLKTSFSGLENQMQSFCHSLDSFEINEQSQFERVQSLEDLLDCNDLQSNIVLSDIETEDSGVHTARDPADDIADLSQVASPIGDPTPSEYESSNEDAAPVEPCKVDESDKKCIESIEIIPEDTIVEVIEETDIKTENTDSESNYIQAVSQPEELSSVTDDVTELHMDKDDEDTLKSLENQDTSVLDALEMAFQELDSEDCFSKKKKMDKDESKKSGAKPELTLNEKLAALINFDDDPLEKINPTPLYENIDIFYQQTAAGAETFPLDIPSYVLEPPKEKPPPPPVEESPEDDELLGHGNFKHTSSARRIKKEIRNKRTSFLGIEGQVDGSYLDVDLKLAPNRPDITSFLQEETKIEKLLYKKTLSHEMDEKLRESRDSGVDIDRGPSAEAWYKGQSSPEMSNPHSRQNSEPYNNVTVTSDEDEVNKKQSEQNFSSNLTSKLTDISNVDHNESRDNKLDTLDKKLQEQQTRPTNEDCLDGLYDDVHTKEVLRFERELLQLEQEELRRQRDNLIRDQTRIIQKSAQDVSSIPSPQETQIAHMHLNNDHRRSMPNLLAKESFTVVEPIVEKPVFGEKRKPFVSEEHIERHFGVEESRKVLYDGGYASEAARKPVSSMARPTQPILPPKPKTRESLEREITMRSSRVPSASDYQPVLRNTAGVVPVAPPPVPAHSNGHHHPMTRHTLQALSAAPTPKLISNAEWMQAKSKKPNYNHWLIQEAEQRRIDSQRNKLRAAQRHSYHQDMVPPHPLMHKPFTSSHHHLNASSSELRAPPRPVLPSVEPRTMEPRLLEPQTTDQEKRDDKVLSVSGKRRCSHCGEQLGRGAAMVIESLGLCYHVWCFRCGVCGAALGDGRGGADVRLRGATLHCAHCHSTTDGTHYSRV